MFVKICGTTNLADAELSIEAGADALGFIFAPSKRRVTVEQVAAITAKLPAGVERVGVFAEPDAEEIVAAVRRAGLTAVQMHFGRDEAVIGALHAQGVKLWQVVGFEVDAADPGQAEQRFAEELAAALRDERLSVVLLDAVRGGASGGLGQAFSWERAAAVLQSVRAAVGDGSRGVPKIALAGGLRPENVGEAIAALRPWGVDVVSGVEASPGRKNPERVAAFVREARGAAERFPPL